MSNKPKTKLGLHKHIATGGKPSTYKGAAASAVANKKSNKK